MQGRGSAANSAVCYSLGITAVDPVAMELLFERFLSEERGEWPDIDLDLPSGDDRERAIQYVYERYGKLGAAMTANVITYRSRSAVRDVGKALGFDEESLGRISKLAGRGAWEMENPGRITNGINSFSDAGLDLLNGRVSKLHDLVAADPESSPASGAAFRRHGDLPGAARFDRSSGTRDHAGPRHRAVG